MCHTAIEKPGGIKQKHQMGAKGKVYAKIQGMWESHNICVASLFKHAYSMNQEPILPHSVWPQPWQEYNLMHSNHWVTPCTKGQSRLNQNTLSEGECD